MLNYIPILHKISADELCYESIKNVLINISFKNHILKHLKDFNNLKLKSRLKINKSITSKKIDILKNPKCKRIPRIEPEMYETIYLVAKLFGYRLISSQSLDDYNRVYNTFILYGPDDCIESVAILIEELIGYINKTIEHDFKKRVQYKNKLIRLQKRPFRFPAVSDKYRKDILTFYQETVNKELINLINNVHPHSYKILAETDRYLVKFINLDYSRITRKPQLRKVYQATLKRNIFKINRVLYCELK